MNARLGLLALLYLAGCATSKEVERSQAARTQELEARVTELAARLEWESGETRRAQNALEEARRKVQSLEEEREKGRARSAALSLRLESCDQHEAGLRADLDLCRRARQSLDEELGAARSELMALRSADQKARAGWTEEIERCRGKAADLEAQAAVLAAERRREQQEKAEKVDEISRTYGGLLEDAKREAGDCRQRLALAEADLARLEAAQKEAEEAGRARCTEVARLQEKLSAVLAEVPGSSVSSAGGRVKATIPNSHLFVPSNAQLSATGRSTVARFGEALRGEQGFWVVVSNPREASKLSGDAARRFGTAREFAAARAATVARQLGVEVAAADGEPAPVFLSLAGASQAEATPAESARSLEIEFVSAQVIPCPPSAPGEERPLPSP